MFDILIHKLYSKEVIPSLLIQILKLLINETTIPNAATYSYVIVIERIPSLHVKCTYWLSV